MSRPTCTERNYRPVIDTAARMEREARRQDAPPIPAVVRLRMARATYAPPLWTDNDGFADLDPIGPFSIRVQVQPDDVGSDDFMGEFVSEAEDGVTVESPRRYAPSWAQTEPHYRPMWSIDDRFTYWRSSGADKATARRWALMGAQGEASDAANYEPYGVTVTASIDGREFGSASLWGIDYNTDSASAYLMEVVTELAEEAVADAWQNLETAYGVNGRQLFLLADA